MSDLFASLTLSSSVVMKNRFMLAPLTNCQSYENGRLSEDEFRWLLMSAKGGFAVTMTGAASVQRSGKGFAGQLGIYSEQHIERLSRLAVTIRAESSIALIQLHHAGIRSFGADPVGPSAYAKYAARALTESEIEQVIVDFITAAERAERAGFDGVEIHGGPGYLLGSFLSRVMNQRCDVYGGSLDNRARTLRAIIAGIRKRCRPGFILGLRLSPEGYGIPFDEVRLLAGELLAESAVHFLDLFFWQVMENPEENILKDRCLIEWFAELPRGRTRLGVAGHIQRSRNNLNYEDLDNSLRRLKRGTVDVSWIIGSKRYIFVGSLIDSYIRELESKLYRVTLSPEIRTLFSHASWTQLEWEELMKLRGKPLAQWLHSYFSTHARPYPVTVEFLKEKTGSPMKLLKHFKVELRNALQTLQDLIGWTVEWDGNLVKVMRPPTDSQARHLTRIDNHRKALETIKSNRKRSVRSNLCQSAIPPWNRNKDNNDLTPLEQSWELCSGLLRTNAKGEHFTRPNTFMYIGEHLARPTVGGRSAFGAIN